MLYRKNAEKELSRALFENPPSEYRGTPFWSWNCRVTKELITEQLENFRKMGFGGAHLHPRTGLDVPYLSEEYFDLIRFAGEECKRLGLLCWLYDEDRYPSGAAGGLVTEDNRFRARWLLFTREKKDDLCASRAEFLAQEQAGGHPAGYFLAAYRVKTEGGRLVSWERLSQLPETDSAEETRRAGKLWLAYVELMRESPWFNDQTYVDVMNPEAVRRFLALTHERYFEAVGDEFGKSIPAIFTDEPQLKGSMVLPDGESEADVTLSFTDDFPETFLAATGTDLLDYLPELLWEKPEGGWSPIRIQYHDHLAERFASAYGDAIASWCGAHGLALTGHYMSEPTLYTQTLRLGETMRCYRSQQLPGIDILCGDPEYTTAKQAVSVARQDGREGVLSELYGVNHWDFDFKGHKLQGDWQAALGVTIRVPHLSFMSMEGEAKRDWPASIQYQSPWWEEYSYIENYFARVNTALTRGKAEPSLAVVHPIESFWLLYGPQAETRDRRQQLDGNFVALARWLLYGLVDFDYLSESMLPARCTGAFTEDGRLSVGEMRYRTVLLPGLLTIRSSTLERLEALLDAGGRVVFLGNVPELVDGLPSDRAKRLAARAEAVPFEEADVLRAAEPDRRIEVRGADGNRSDNLFYQLRRDGDAHWLFLCHVDRRRNREDAQEVWRLRVRGSWQLERWDALTGSVREEPAQVEDGWTCLTLRCWGQDSFLWKLTEAAPQQAAGASETAQGAFPVPTGERTAFYGLVAGSRLTPSRPRPVLRILEAPDAFTLEEPNVLLLDRPSWRLDGGDWQPPEEILRVDNRIRARLGYPRRQDASTQPWRIPDEPERHAVTLRYTIDARAAADGLRLAMERPDKADIFWNGEAVPHADDGWFTDRFIRTVPLPPLREGENELVLRLPFVRKTNLENVFVLGAFGVFALGTHAVVTKQPERIYFGDVSRQGFAFYGGTLRYTMGFSLARDTALAVRVPHFAAPVLEILVDGESRGLMAFAPHTLELGTLPAGEHMLTVRCFGSRFNSFGTLHNCNDEYKWYGPDSYRTQGGEWSEAWQTRPFGLLSRVELVGPEQEA